MNASLSLLSLMPLVIAAPVETKFAQVAPLFRETPPFRMSPGQQRAVVLIQGIRPHPFSRHDVARAEWYRWQLPGGTLVTTLGKQADVFAFAYSQNEAVERVPDVSDFGDRVRSLKRMGYREIVLIGHSAGGLVARHFVEDHPDAGVTKVIQICAPNGGTSWGKARIGVREPQEPFLSSLSKKGRRQCLAKRTEKRAPREMEFICIVGQVKAPGAVTLSIESDKKVSVAITLGTGNLRGDGVVSSRSQWPEDLQEQGIPALFVATSHFTATQSKAVAETIAELVRERQPRWDAAKVAEARRKFLGRDDSP